MLKDLMIDSGAFTADTKGVRISLEDYADFLRKFGPKLRPVAAISLDVIGDGKGSYKNWRLLTRSGVQVLPVYHLGTDEKWLLRYLEECDYVAIGAIANVNTRARLIGLDYVWKTYLLDSSGKPKVKVHGLGLTAVPMMTRYPWHSVDSAMVFKHAAFGKIDVPTLTEEAGLVREDWQNMRNIIVSERGGGVKGRDEGRTYFTLSERQRNLLDRFLAERGFYVDGWLLPPHKRPMTKRMRRALRADPRWEEWLKAAAHSLLDLEEPVRAPVAEGNRELRPLSVYENRVIFNTMAYYEMSGRVTMPILYHSASSMYLFRMLERSGVGFNLLMSYYYLTIEKDMVEELAKAREAADVGQ